MCGINGIFAYAPSAPKPEAEECLRVRDAMSARGPDGSGLFRNPTGRIMLGHRRLAIIDLAESGAQPMSSPDDDVVVTFNGEIYNYRAIRAELQERGIHLNSASDTEVLLHLYRIHGLAMVDRLAGMFAFAIWDSRKEVLVLARDPYGIKPLYYSDDGRSFRFASSVRALMTGAALSRDFDPAGVRGFLAWGSIPDPHTLFRSVRALPPGSVMEVGSEGPSGPREYWRPCDAYDRPIADGQRSTRPEESQVQIREALLESVTRHLVADIPVGLFLSAGVDSAALLALATEAGGTPLHTVTLAFEEFRGTPQDEAPLAKSTAAFYGAQHETVVLSAEQVRRGLDDFVRTMDQPSIDGLNTYLVSQAVRQAGLKAAMSGVGGDELFGGYATFRRMPILRRLGPLARVPLLSDMAGTLGARFFPGTQQAKIRAAPQALRQPASTYHLLRGLFTIPEVATLLGRSTAWAAADPEPAKMKGVWKHRGLSLWAKTAIAEQSNYLPNQLLRTTDWASMAHSLEVRTPLVDYKLSMRLAPLLATAAPHSGKGLLAGAPRKALPPALLARPKSGFGLPLQRWVADDCRKGWRPSLPPELATTSGNSAVQQLAAQVAAGTNSWSRIWAVRILGEYAESVGA